MVVSKKKADLKPLFGVLKETTKSAQELKDEVNLPIHCKRWGIASKLQASYA